MAQPRLSTWPTRFSRAIRGLPWSRGGLSAAAVACCPASARCLPRSETTTWFAEARAGGRSRTQASAGSLSSVASPSLRRRARSPRCPTVIGGLGLHARTSGARVTMAGTGCVSFLDRRHTSTSARDSGCAAKVLRLGHRFRAELVAVPCLGCRSRCGNGVTPWAASGSATAETCGCGTQPQTDGRLCTRG